MPSAPTRKEVQARVIISETVPIVRVRMLCFIHSKTWENPDDFVDEKSIFEREAREFKCNAIDHMGKMLYEHRWIINPTKADSRFRLSAAGELVIHDAYAKLNKWEEENNRPLTKNPEDEEADAPAKSKSPKAQEIGVTKVSPPQRPGTPA